MRLLLVPVAFFGVVLLTHHASAVPALGLEWTSGLAGLPSLVAAVFCLCVAMQRCRGQKTWRLGIVLTALAGGLALWPELAERKLKQLPADCHNAVLQADWQIESSTWSAQGQRWILREIQRSPKSQDASGTHLCIWPAGPLRVQVQTPQGHAGKPGDSIVASTLIRLPRAPLQFEGFDLEAHAFARDLQGYGSVRTIQSHSPATALQLLLHWPSRVQAAVSTHIHASLHNHPQYPLVMALVTGDQGLIDADDRKLYSETGIAHLVAISGFHIQMLVWAVAALCTTCWRRSAGLCLKAPAQQVGMLCGLLAGLAYALVAGWGIPAQRTVLMQGLSFVCKNRGLRVSVWTQWAWALAAVCLLDPWAVLSPSCHLSFGAVALLIWAGTPSNTALLREQHPAWRRALSQGLHAQWVATLGLLPVCAFFFGQISALSLPVNVLAIPWMSSVATPLAALGGLLHQTGLLHLAAWCLDRQHQLLEWVTQVGQGAVWSVPQQPEGLLLLSMWGALGVLHQPAWLVSRAERWARKTLAVLALLALGWPAPRPQIGELWVDLIDVGQGSAVLLRTAHHNLLIDTGPPLGKSGDAGERMILPALRALGVQQLQELWISHDDSDHTGGALSVLKAVKVDRMVHSLPSESPAWAMAQMQGSELVDSHASDAALAKRTLDEVEIRAFSTESRSENQAKLKDNDRSCVLQLRVGAHQILIPGDLEWAGEMALLKASQDDLSALQSTVLIAPHHGSKTSSSDAFLNAVQPQHVLIQSGWKNKYGHPHSEVMARYAQRGLQVLNTAQNGALRVELNPESAQPKFIGARQTGMRYWHMHE